MEWGKFLETLHFLHVWQWKELIFLGLLYRTERMFMGWALQLFATRRMIATPFQLLPALCNYMRNSQAVGISTLPPKAAVLKF